MARLQRTLGASFGCPSMLSIPASPSSWSGVQGEACEMGLTNQSSHPGIAPGWAQVPGPPVRTLPGVSELWVKGQGSGVDLLGPSPPGEKATHLQERRDGNQGQTSRRAWVEGRRPDGWRPGPGLPPQLFLQVCDTPAPSILTWSKLKRKPMFYTNETNVFM